MYDGDDFTEGTLFIDREGEYGICTSVTENEEYGEIHEPEIHAMFFKDVELNIVAGKFCNICMDTITPDYVDTIIDKDTLNTMTKMKIEWLINKYAEEIAECTSH